MATDIKAALYTYLSGKSGITAVFGTPPRIYAGTAPKSATFPYATYSLISNNHRHHMRGASGITAALVQFDVFDNDSVNNTAGFEALRLALDGSLLATWGAVTVRGVFNRGERQTFISPVDDSEVGVYATSCDYEIWYNEDVPTF
jgi:hypothetical protein